MTTTLRASALSKSFSGQEPIFGEISIELSSGDFTVISGQPGQGRSTLLRCFTGAYPVDSGQLRLVQGDTEVDLTDRNPRVLSNIRRHHLGIFDGEVTAIPSQQAVEVVARLGSVDTSRAHEGLAKLGEETLAGKKFGTLRRHQRAVIGLVGTLLSSAPLLILDSPDRYADCATLGTWLDELRLDGRGILLAPADSRNFHEQQVSGNPMNHHGNPLSPINFVTLQEGAIS